MRWENQPVPPLDPENSSSNFSSGIARGLRTATLGRCRPDRCDRIHQVAMRVRPAGSASADQRERIQDRTAARLQVKGRQVRGTRNRGRTDEERMALVTEVLDEAGITAPPRESLPDI